MEFDSNSIPICDKKCSYVKLFGPMLATQTLDICEKLVLN